jgi:Flavodoxin domain
MVGEGRARRDAMQGVKRSNARRHCEHLQRCSARVSRGQHRSDFSDSVDQHVCMQPILVAYVTTEGQTRKVAEFIAQRLRIRGHRVDLVDVATANALDVAAAYQAALLGGSAHYGRHQGALLHFVESNLAGSTRCRAPSSQWRWGRCTTAPADVRTLSNVPTISSRTAALPDDELAQRLNLLTGLR